ncbi:hypothetical protein M0804_007766 [Polistes exclamans]|nr:hypothetical protein M0804_007766 [Polistes exclamans]
MSCKFGIVGVFGAHSTDSGTILGSKVKFLDSSGILVFHGRILEIPRRPVVMSFDSVICRLWDVQADSRSYADEPNKRRRMRRRRSRRRRNKRKRKKRKVDRLLLKEEKKKKKKQDIFLFLSGLMPKSRNIVKQIIPLATIFVDSFKMGLDGKQQFHSLDHREQRDFRNGKGTIIRGFGNTLMSLKQKNPSQANPPRGLKTPGGWWRQGLSSRVKFSVMIRSRSAEEKKIKDKTTTTSTTT